jgi:hypothetical protein
MLKFLKLLGYVQRGPTRKACWCWRLGRNCAGWRYVEVWSAELGQDLERAKGAVVGKGGLDERDGKVMVLV